MRRMDTKDIWDEMRMMKDKDWEKGFDEKNGWEGLMLGIDEADKWEGLMLRLDDKDGWYGWMRRIDEKDGWEGLC